MEQSPKRKPMYVQIKEYILAQIDEQAWGANHRLPSENELAKQFDVSSITVKNALAQLVESKQIYRIQGKGSFVASGGAGEPYLYEQAAAYGANPARDKPLVGFLMPRLNSRHTAALLNAIESELAENGLHLVFRKTNDSPELEKQAIREMLELGVKGMLVFPVDNESYSEELMRLTLNQFPHVLVDRYLRGIETNSVYSDNIGGAQAGTQHLIELGHKHIGFISTPNTSTSSIEDRILGYEKALKENYLPIDLRLQKFDIEIGLISSILDTGVVGEELKAQIKSYLLANPQMTAVFAVNAVLGTAVADAAMELGLSIPGDLSVIFFDNDNMQLAGSPPTFVGQQDKEIGRVAVRLLVAIMGDSAHAEKQRVALPANLVVGRTTGPCRVEARRIAGGNGLVEQE